MSSRPWRRWEEHRCFGVQARCFLDGFLRSLLYTMYPLTSGGFGYKRKPFRKCLIFAALLGDGKGVSGVGVGQRRNGGGEEVRTYSFSVGRA